MTAPWQLDSLIAVGGIGEVWLAHRDGATAAVKRLHGHLLHHAEAAALFATEQQLAASLPHHPHLVHAIDTGATPRPYLAMPVAPGANLRELGPQPRDRALAITVAACRAATHLHDHGWVHGDIHPGNLVVSPTSITLIDLGIARPSRAAGPVRGTHAHMAPEQIRGEPWTPATDAFALGILAWELLASTRLFHRGAPWLSMAAVMESTPPPLSDPANAIVQAALSRDPLRRPSVSELAGELAASAPAGAE
ncbi:MAG: serine/threonine-protein kinase [Kofleriaceae bacterium]